MAPVRNLEHMPIVRCAKHRRLEVAVVAMSRLKPTLCVVSTQMWRLGQAAVQDFLGRRSLVHVTGAPILTVGFGVAVDLGMLPRRTSQFAKNFHPSGRRKLMASGCYERSFQ